MPAPEILFLKSPERAKQWLAEQRGRSHSVGFVPTMGALHEGHLSLVKQAALENEVVVVSIFVNPLQFNDPEDLNKYPRNMDKDLALLASAGCHMAFTGSLKNFFVEFKNTSQIELLDPGPFAQGLEGEFRPGHFSGVKTIVKRLFETVRPNRAYFGEKDFQQCLIIRSLANEMGYPEIITCPTHREANGLAMSSRNQLLSDDEKKIAGKVFQALNGAKLLWDQGIRDASKLRSIMHSILQDEQICIEYADIRDPTNWKKTSPTGLIGDHAQALIAVKLGAVRLIDNLCLK